MLGVALLKRAASDARLKADRKHHNHSMGMTKQPTDKRLSFPLTAEASVYTNTPTNRICKARPSYNYFVTRCCFTAL